MNCEIIAKPTRDHILQIEKWLKEEDIKKREGFYCNWHIILKAIDANHIIILLIDKQAVGFLVYTINELIAEINIAEIQPAYRKHGLGRLLTEHFLTTLIEKGILVVELYCSPLTSETIWEKLNFKSFPIFQRDPKLRLYRTIVPTLNPNDNLDKNCELIELWNDEPYIVVNQPPRWTWPIKYKGDTRELLQPIIQPAFYEWQICWRIGNEILFRDKIKRFSFPDIGIGNFLIIRELPTNL